MERQFGATIEWLPFDLHPEYPPEGIPRSQLNAKYGEGFADNVRRSVEACGYTYNPPPEVVPNSQKALQLTELARARGLHEQVHTRLMDAYWAEAADIGDEETLISLCGEAGLERDDCVETLASNAYRGAVSEATQEAHRLGIHAIPAFVLDQRTLVLGAHPYETFEQAFAQLSQIEKPA